jgi:hypothetical protein
MSQYGSLSHNAFNRNKDNFQGRECVLNFSSDSLRVAMATCTPTLIKKNLSQQT